MWAQCHCLCAAHAAALTVSGIMASGPRGGKRVGCRTCPRRKTPLRIRAKPVSALPISFTISSAPKADACADECECGLEPARAVAEWSCCRGERARLGERMGDRMGDRADGMIERRLRGDIGRRRSKRLWLLVRPGFTPRGSGDGRGREPRACCDEGFARVASSMRPLLAGGRAAVLASADFRARAIARVQPGPSTEA